MDHRLVAVIGFGLLACLVGGWFSDVDLESTDPKSDKFTKQLVDPSLSLQRDGVRSYQVAPVGFDVSQMTDEDVQILGQLPPVCTSELPNFPSPDRPNPRANSQDTQAFDRSGAQSPATSSAGFQGRESSPSHEGVQQVNWDSTVHQIDSSPSLSYPLQRNDFSSKVRQGSLQSPNGSVRPLDRMAMAGHLPNPHANAVEPAKRPKNGEDPHAEVYSQSAFPSADECASCHQQIYDEWASSSHAYASVSPMFHKFENTINRLAQGTIGYFCMRCHAPVATTVGLRRDQAIWDGPKVFREGVTCVACHRVKAPYGKANGERRIEPGDIHAPVYGASDGIGAAIANKYSQYYKTKTDSNNKVPGQSIHRRAIQFEELSKSTFCMSCHQVAVQPGIKLEVVWDQYRASPAYRQGVTCQDCHMGRVPGVDDGYSIGPAAVIDNKVVNPDRKHSNHVFYGPGYSIAHPGIFPHTKESNRWKFNDWLLFDWRAGWGTDQFEDALAEGRIVTNFPPVWQEVDDRYDAREIVDANLKKLEYKRDLRRQLLENGSQLDGPFFASDPQRGQPLKIRYCLTNTNPGHNMPSGSLGAQPQVWMNAVLIGPSGQRLWESGYLDSNGDLADLHSSDVLNRRIPLDKQLFNLQTKFLTTNVKGTDREMYLPVNFDFDQLPFLRPPAQPVTVINHPPFIRMEAHSIPPLGSRNVKYVVPGNLMQEPGIYRLSVRMRSRAEPIYFMKFCDSTPEMERMMNEWIADFHTHSVTFEVR